VPRAGLRPSIVIAEAASLADDVGFDHLTLAALAARLKVAVPSLYKHVDGLGALRRGIAILALHELGAAMAEGLARAGGEDSSAHVRALAAAYRAYAGAHPGRYAATLRAAPPGDPEHVAASEAVLERVLAVLAERGLEGEDAIDATRALRAALHGFVSLEAAGGFGMPQDVGRSFARMVRALDRGFDELAAGAMASRSRSSDAPEDSASRGAP
jgi:AcrR family transcriptional regulator